LDELYRRTEPTTASPRLPVEPQPREIEVYYYHGDLVPVASLPVSLVRPTKVPDSFSSTDFGSAWLLAAT
jgi:hypothetical protein